MNLEKLPFRQMSTPVLGTYMFTHILVDLTPERLTTLSFLRTDDESMPYSSSCVQKELNSPISLPIFNPTQMKSHLQESLNTRISQEGSIQSSGICGF